MAQENGGGGWFVVLVLGWIFWMVTMAVLHSKVRYFVEYGAPNDISYGQVTKDDIPHDCDWLKAPLGDKECHYEANVQIIRTGRDVNSGRPIYSYDDGKTWLWNDSANGSEAVKSSVYVGWNKVED